MWGSELQEHSLILGKSTGKVMIQHVIPLTQKTTLGPAQTNSRIILGRGGKVVRLTRYKEKGSPCGFLPSYGRS